MCVRFQSTAKSQHRHSYADACPWPISYLLALHACRCGWTCRSRASPSAGWRLCCSVTCLHWRQRTCDACAQVGPLLCQFGGGSAQAGQSRGAPCPAKRQGPVWTLGRFCSMCVLAAVLPCTAPSCGVGTHANPGFAVLGWLGKVHASWSSRCVQLGPNISKSPSARVGSFTSYMRELFGRFFVQSWGQEGPLPGNYTQLRSLYLCSCTVYMHSLLNLTAKNVAARWRMAVGALLLEHA